MDNVMRRLPLTGLKNARELGGFPTRDGKVTKYGVFLRSEVPVRLTQEDLDCLRRYGVTQSVDLRGMHETQHLVSMLKDLDWCKYVHAPMFNLQVSMEDFLKQEPKPDKYSRHPATPDVDWPGLYISMLEEYTPWTKRILELAAECEGVMLYHCTTGKDRTGMMTAMLLSIAGVEDDDIIADYCVSQVYMRPVYKELMKTMPPLYDENGNELMPDIDGPFFRTAPGNMRGLLEHLEGKYGSVEGYIRHCGVSDETIRTIRGKLVG